MAWWDGYDVDGVEWFDYRLRKFIVMTIYEDNDRGGDGTDGDHGGDVADAASTGRNADETDGVDSTLSSDRETVREGLYAEAVARQADAAAEQGEVGFGRQMVQLALIPALIVCAVMGVWMLMTTLTGEQQSIDTILNKLDAVPKSVDDGGIAGRPNYQDVFRNAMMMAGVIEGGDMTPEVREKVRTRLEAMAIKHQGGDGTFLAFIMKSLGTLANSESVPIFDTLLTSSDAHDQYAALLGLYNWQGRGDMSATHTLAADIIPLLQSKEQVRTEKDSGRIGVMAAAVLAGVADENDMAARDALAKVVDQAGPDNREEVWNAGCAIAALGDERGIPVVISLLDRKWLSEQADLDHPESGRKLSVAAQDKLMKTVLNVLVRFVPGEGDEKGHFVVRVDDAKVWDRVQAIADNDPSESVRAIANEVLKIRDSG